MVYLLYLKGVIKMNDKYIKNEDVLFKEKSYLHFINSEFKEALHFKSHEIENELENRINTIISSRSEEHTSELQSRFEHVCRLLLEKKTRTKTFTSPLLD